MKFFIYNVSILTCCLFIFTSCKKKSEDTTNPPLNPSNTQSVLVQEEEKKSENTSSDTASENNKVANTKPSEVKQPEISIPQEPEEPDEEKPIATPPAVTAFVTQMKESGVAKLASELEELEELGQDSPGLAFEVLRELSAKAATLDPSELPEDLKNEFETLSTGLRDIVSHIETSPIPTEVMAEGREAIGAWFLEQSQADPDFGQDFGEVMRSWGAEMQELGSTLEVAGDNMEELFEKYGIDESELEN
ncbi:MAG: hypothetical protein ACJ0IZ_08665 [Verrucomicrobiales bacterium]|nr:hypothetical protein [Verrucomicrobiales bacterium]